MRHTLSIASQIHTLLKDSGKLARTPRTTTIQARLDRGEYLYVTTAHAAPIVGELRDQNGNAVSLAGYDADTTTTEPKVVGVIMARKLNWYLGEVRHLVVDPAFRSRGLGKKLFDMAEAKLKAAKARVLVATDSSDDTESVAERYGFDSDLAADGQFDFTNAATGRNVAVLLKNLA